MTMISVDVTGTTGGSDHSMPAGISTNGQFVLFESQATNLVAGDNNPAGDVFLRDLVGQTTTLVSASTNSGCGNGASTDSTMTPDGRYVAFSSLASNLVPGDTNDIGDVFFRDTQLGATVLISVGAQAVTLNPAYRYNATYSGASSSDLPEITPDGRYVAFLSTATNLVPGGTNPGEMYVRDVVGNLTYCVSTNADHSFTNLACFSQRISTNGEYVVFEAFSVSSSKAGIILRHNIQSGVDDVVTTNAAVPTDYYKNIQSLDMTPDGRFIAFVSNTNATSTSSIVVWDGQTATTTVVSQGTSGAICDSPQIDPTGRYVSFRSTATGVATNVVSAGSQHLYLADLQAGTTQLVDVTTNGAGSAGLFISSQSMDSSGRYIVFDSTGSDMATNDNNGVANVFLRDTLAAATQLISAHHPLLASQTGVPIGISHRYNMSADGRYLAFAANATGLTPGYTNQYRGIFVRDLVAQTNMLVSVSTNGIGDANGWSTDPMISGNGRYVAFTSWASNLVKNDTNHASDVFVRDLQMGTTTMVSSNVSSSLWYEGFGSPLINFDGTYVLFENASSIFLRNQTNGIAYTLTTNATATPAMTPDGHYIAFTCSLSSLLFTNLYVWDSQAATRVYTNTSITSGSLVAISSNGLWLAEIASAIGVSRLYLINRVANTNEVIGGIRNWGNFGPRTGLRLSGDGRFLVYSSTETNVPVATNGFEKVYVFDFQSGTNTLISGSYASQGTADADSDNPDISEDGRYIVYETWADDIVPASNNGYKNVYLYDQQTGSTTLLSVSIVNSGAANYESVGPSFTGDGQTVVFQSFASDLVTNDYNLGGDLFVLDLSTTNGTSGSTNLPLFQVNQLIYASGSSGSVATSPTLTWTAVPGTAYQVVYKDNLTDPTWQPLNGSITIVGNQGQAVDFTPNPVHRFYMIVAN